MPPPANRPLGSCVRRERLTVVGNEAIGPYVARSAWAFRARARNAWAVLHARGARAACCRGRSASASRRPASSASSSIRSARARARSRRSRPATRSRVTGPLGQRLRPRRRAAAARRRRHRRRAAAVPLRAARRPAARCSASAPRTTPRRPRSCRTPRSCIDPTLVTDALPDDPGDVLACGPEPMLDALARLVPGAQLAWEAPMACGYGACYGCVVRSNGGYRRLCVDGPVLRTEPSMKPWASRSSTPPAVSTRWPRPRSRGRSTRS